MLVKLNGNQTFSGSPFMKHQQFVERDVPTPMCLKVFVEKQKKTEEIN